MALTRDTTLPISPLVHLINGGRAATLMPFVCKASEAYRIGDVVALASGAADAVGDAGGITAATILGVAVQAKTAGGTVSSTDTVILALALPGQCFTGSLVGGAATDHTPNATPATEQAFVTLTDFIVGTDSYSTFQMLNAADTTTSAGANIFRFSDNQLRGQRFVLGMTTPVNPRMDFVFQSTFFMP